MTSSSGFFYQRQDVFQKGGENVPGFLDDMEVR
jgi:hypothetical protein